MNRHISQGLRAAGSAGHACARRRRVFALATVGFGLLLTASAAPAQDGSDAPPAHISLVDGTAVLERDGQSDSSPASMPLLAGDRIRTQSGRVEILFADGSTLHIDNYTVVDFQSDEVVRLLDGRIRLNIAGRGRSVAYRVDGPAGWVQIYESGEYRIAVLRGEREPQVELAVLRGEAELVNEDGRSVVRAGERAFARAGAQPSPPYVFNSAAWDAFDRWSESRRDQRLGLSAQYLPSDVQPYAATFDHYGSWRYEQAYGYVWYPRVHVAWRPYYYGRWVGLRPFGWTWIARDPWGWPTHHYGRWGFSAGSWFWIPGRRWGAAWVSWAYAPDYVSWCPLGWNDRPVFSFVNVNLNFFGGRRYDPWYAWTVVPRRHFGTGFVNVHVVAGSRLDGRVRSTFVVRDSAPDWRYAVPRASAAIRTPGRTGYAVPRGSTNASLSGATSRDEVAPSTRSFPSPARQPRIAGTDGRSLPRSSAPVTSAPDRAVPRDRSVARDAYQSPVDRSGRTIVPDSRARDSGASTDGRRLEPSATVPPDRSRAVPRRTPDVDAQGTPERDWRRYDRGAPRTAPEYRSEAGRSQPDAGGRRAPDQYEAGDRYRAVPRQDVPRPSYQAPREAPRSGGEAPPRTYGAPPRSESQPRSYGSPRVESPRSSGGAPERRSSEPSADRPSRSAPSGEGGQSRSRGGQPSQGQAVRRPGGR